MTASLEYRGGSAGDGSATPPSFSSIERGYEIVLHFSDKSRGWRSWGWGGYDRIILYGSGIGQNNGDAYDEDSWRRCIDRAQAICEAVNKS